MSARRVITLSYYFPPLVGIASERALARADSLRRFGWDVTVVTTRNGHYHAVAEDREFEFPVIRTASVELSRVARRVYATARRSAFEAGPADGTVRAVSTGSLGSRLRRWVREWVYIPDAQVGWIPAAALASARAAAGGDAVIVSTSVPYSAHLAACFAARWRRVRWVAEFRDPWTTADETLLPHGALRRRIDVALERLIVGRADHVIVTSATTRTNLLAAHPRLSPERVSVVMNGFVPTGELPAPAPEEPCCFVYAGTVAPGERPDVLLRAFERLAAVNPGGFRFRVLGPREPWRSPGGQIPPWLELAGVVTPAEARNAIVAATATILLQHHPGRTEILSGKAFEYIGARRPILAVVQEKSEMAQLLRTHADARLVPAYDVDLLATELQRLVEEHSRGALTGPTVPRERVEALARDSQALVLDGILRHLS